MKRDMEEQWDPELVYQLCELAKIEEDPAKRIVLMECIIEMHKAEMHKAVTENLD